MSLRNKVTLIGRTGKDVEIVKFENGKIAKVSLATSDHYTNALGEKVEETQWHNLVANGKLADIMEKYVEKGKEIAVEGKIIYRNWDDKEGVKHYITENETLSDYKTLKELITLKGRNELWIGKGRNLGEKSFLIIEEGKLISFGYYELFHQIQSRKKLNKLQIEVKKVSPEIINDLKLSLLKNEYKIEKLPK